MENPHAKYALELAIYERVARIAFETVESVMLENYEHKLSEGDNWQEKPVAYHLEHAAIHGEIAKGHSYRADCDDPGIRRRTIEEAQHMVTRGAMALVLLTASEIQTPTEVPPD